MSERMLDVYLGDQLAGTLRDAGNRLLEFSYADKYRRLFAWAWRPLMHGCSAWRMTLMPR